MENLKNGKVFTIKLRKSGHAHQSIGGDMGRLAARRNQPFCTGFPEEAVGMNKGRRRSH